jgi:hypothetical protein
MRTKKLNRALRFFVWLSEFIKKIKKGNSFLRDKSCDTQKEDNKAHKFIRKNFASKNIWIFSKGGHSSVLAMFKEALLYL